MMQFKRVLSIAGSDSGGGAGIQADIKTISACGCYAMTAVTAVTVQNTLGVSEVHPVPVTIIEGQIISILEDIGVDSVKIGMLHTSEVIHTVKNALKTFGIRNVVLDPVMVSTSGHKLMQDDAIETLKKELLPEVKIITPNIPEAEIILGARINKPKDLLFYAKELSFGRKVSVLLKAGHLAENILTDVFYNADSNETLELKSERIATVNTHGTGCTLSSAVAAFLAHNMSLNEAVLKAKDYIQNAISEGSVYKTGKGHGPVHHFFGFWK